MEKSKLYYIASLANSDFQFMVELSNENDVETDNCTLVYFPVFSLRSELSNPTYFKFLLYNVKILISIILFWFKHESSNGKDLE